MVSILAKYIFIIQQNYISLQRFEETTIQYVHRKIMYAVKYNTYYLSLLPYKDYSFLYSVLFADTTAIKQS